MRCNANSTAIPVISISRPARCRPSETASGSWRRPLSPAAKPAPAPFLRELIIPFGRTGYVALFEVVDDAASSSARFGTSGKTTTTDLSEVGWVLGNAFAKEAGLFGS